jgi:hypothetical protein
MLSSIQELQKVQNQNQRQPRAPAQRVRSRGVPESNPIALHACVAKLNRNRIIGPSSFVSGAGTWAQIRSERPSQRTDFGVQTSRRAQAH